MRVLPVDKIQIYLLFYKPTATDPWLNRVVAFWDGPFSHVELAIPDRYGEEPWERVIWGSSIYQDEPVFFKQKTYKREGYVSIAIEVTLPQAHRIRCFCRAHAERETGFSPLAMYAAYLPVQLVHTDRTFCSKHVTEALQMADVSAVRHINAALTTPSKLYRAISRLAILQVVPSKMVQIIAQQQQQQQQQKQSKQLPHHGRTVTHGGAAFTGQPQTLADAMTLTFVS